MELHSGIHRACAGGLNNKCIFPAVHEKDRPNKKLVMLGMGEETFRRQEANDPTQQDIGFPTAGAAAYIIDDIDHIEARNMQKGLQLRSPIYQRPTYMTRSS